MADKNTMNKNGSVPGARLTGLIGLFAFVITFGILLIGAIIGITKLLTMIWRAVFGT
jgi:hypothetical protein